MSDEDNNQVLEYSINNQSSETIDTFRKNLKTYLYEIAFPP